MRVQRHQNTEAGQQGHHRGSAVAYEGKRYADDRKQARNHPCVDEHVDEEGEREASGEQPRKRVLRLHGEKNRAADDEHIEQQQQSEPEETELFADYGEDEISGALREKLELRLAAVHPALAENTPRADRDLRLDDVIAGA